MNALGSLSVLAALSLAGAAYAQTETAPNGFSNDMRPRVPPVQSVSDGMRVESESGDLLGTVASIVPGRAPNERYVLIANSKGVAIPVPYSTASGMVQNHTLVIDKARFEHAPKVQQGEVEDTQHSAWEKRADDYWSRAKR